MWIVKVEWRWRRLHERFDVVPEDIRGTLYFLWISDVEIEARCANSVIRDQVASAESSFDDCSPLSFHPFRKMHEVSRSIVKLCELLMRDGAQVFAEELLPGDVLSD